MRTKSIILGAALLAAGVATSMAQVANVYSVNVVGYVNVPVTTGHFYLIENPLNQSPNTVSNVIPITDQNFDSSFISIYDPVHGVLNSPETYVGGVGWSPGTTIINPGQGFYFFANNTGTLTFAGTVVTNSTINLPSGFSMVGSPYPAAASLTTLGIPAQDSDLLFRFDSTNLNLTNVATFVGGIGWSDNVGSPTNGPTLRVGEAFFYFNSQGGPTESWVQNFFIQ